MVGVGAHTGGQEPGAPGSGSAWAGMTDLPGTEEKGTERAQTELMMMQMCFGQLRDEGWRWNLSFEGEAGSIFPK